MKSKTQKAAATTRCSHPGKRSFSAPHQSSSGKARGVKCILTLIVIQLVLCAGVLKANSFSTTGSMSAARDGQTTTVLLNGKVLVAGGWNGSTLLATAELYNPATGTWTNTGSFTTARAGHQATLLRNGKVLLSGGQNGSTSISTCYLYDPGTGTWSATGSMLNVRTHHSAVLLANGKVLVSGGTQANASAELYDPATGAWSYTGSNANWRMLATSTLLNNGKVLLAGGQSAAYRADCELYNPATGTWSATGSLTGSRAYHTATLLPNGNVLVTGGLNSSTTYSNAQIYSVSSGTWSSTASMSVAHQRHAAVLLPFSGKVLIAGGTGIGYLTRAEIYDPVAGTWATTGALNTARAIYWPDPNNLAAWLPSIGKVLIAGGSSSSSPTMLSSAELFTPDEATTVNRQNGLKGYWKLDEASGTRYDSTANAFDMTEFNTVGYDSAGVLNGAAVIDASYQDQGLHTSGTNAQVTLAFTADWTLSAWVNHTNKVYDADHILAKPGEVYLYTANYDGYEHMYAYIYDGTSGYNTVLSHKFAYILPYNTWTHVVLQRSGPNLNLFVNGQLAETVPMTGSVQNSGEDFWIGMQQYGWPWNGLIDEVGCWGRGLNPIEINTLYGGGTPPANNVALLSGLKSYWKLDETNSTRYDSTVNGFDLGEFNTVGYDSAGALNGAASVDASYQDQGLHTSGTNAQSTLAMSGNWTLSCWVNHTGKVYDADMILTKPGEVYLYTANYNGPEHLYVYVYDGSIYWNTLLSYEFSYVLPFNQWKHIVLQRDGSNINLFVDGQFEETVSISGSVQNAGEDFWIGMHSSGWPWNGSIDEVGCWGRSLNTDEVSTLYGNSTPPVAETFSF
jgi:hypothetical protein